MNSHIPNPHIVLKVGGNEIDSDSFLDRFVQVVAGLRRSMRPVIVHGGGKEIGELHQRMGVPFEFVEGLRVTRGESLRLVEMVLSGVVNTRLTRWLGNGGVDALGITGVDLGLVRVQPLRPKGQDIGFVGEVVQVRTESLHALLAAGFVPVIAPISLGLDGQSYNVNADQVASGLATALGARQLAFVSNVPGVLVDDQALSQISITQAEALIGTGQIFGGMVPKVRAAIAAVQAGVPQAVITDLEGLRQGGGTVVMQ